MGTPGHKHLLGGEIKKEMYEEKTNITVVEKNVTDMELIKYISFKAGLTFFFSEKLQGVKLKTRMFTTMETDPEKYDGWTFKDSIAWDILWFADSSQILVNGLTFYVGESNILPTQIPLTIDQVKHIGMASGTHVLGVPVGFKDEVIDTVNYSPATFNLD